MKQPIAQVDAFTDKPFFGNPAGVCVMTGPASEDWMRGVAREMNLAESAFLYPADDGFNLRWFTPAVEVALCGHATLGASHLLWEEGRVPGDATIHYHTKSGVLTARKQGSWIELDFPARPVSPAELPTGALEALGLSDSLYVGKSTYDYFVEVGSEAIVRGLDPDFGQLRKLPVRGVIVTTRGEQTYDFVSRFFAPGAGVNEDPVTGSAHCTLGPYWKAKLEKDDLLAYQASARGGVVKVGVRGDRILLGGQAVTVIRGELCA